MYKKVVTMYNANLRNLKVGESFNYPRKDHMLYMVSKSRLKRHGEGVWYCTCGKKDREGTVTRIQ